MDLFLFGIFSSVSSQQEVHVAIKEVANDEAPDTSVIVHNRLTDNFADIVYF